MTTPSKIKHKNAEQSFLHRPLANQNGLDFEFTFAVRSRNIEAELPSEALGASKLTDAAMLMKVTIHFISPHCTMLKMNPLFEPWRDVAFAKD